MGMERPDFYMPEKITLEEYKRASGPRNKYFAHRTERDGIWFDSKKEADRYSQLKILERTGEIRNLTLQPVFPIVVNGKKVCNYRADFSYYRMKKAESIVEDCKGIKTPVYRLKKKLFEALYEKQILES